MKRILATLLTLCSFILIAYHAMAANYPCSGKKGGVVKCTTEGKYLCKNGTVSKSKTTCDKDLYKH